MTEVTNTPFDATSSNKEINRLIRQVRKSQETNNVRVHRVMVMCAIHSNNTGDCTGFQRLLTGLPSGLARNASVIINTMKAYTPIQAQASTTGFKVNIAKPGSTNHKPYDIDGLNANPWYTHEDAQKDPVLWSVDKIGEDLLKLADRIGKKIEKGETEEGDNPRLKMIANALRVFAKETVPSLIPSDMQVKEEQSLTPEVEAEVEPLRAVG